jgi:hypothetical protein
MAHPSSTATLTLTAPDTAVEGTPFTISYTVEGDAPGAANMITTVSPSGTLVKQHLDAKSGTYTAYPDSVGRMVVILSTEPGQPAQVQSKFTTKDITVAAS